MSDKKPWETDWENEWENSYLGTDNNYDEASNIVVKDANWAILEAWDTVIAIKDLKWKWVNIKRWDKFKNIRLTDEEWIIESGKLVLKTEFFKKQK